MIDVKTGQVLALANAPTFDSADPGAAKPAGPRQPGGHRPVRAGQRGEGPDLRGADRLRARRRRPPRSWCRNRLPSGGAHSIKDHFDHETICATTCAASSPNSSNIGTALLTRQLSKQKLHDYLASFGLGSPTGIELPGESAGILPQADMPDGQRDQVAFGQAIVGDRRPGGRRHRRHHQRRRLQPADGDQERDRRGRQRGAGRPAAAAPGHLARSPRPRSGT